MIKHGQNTWIKAGRTQKIFIFKKSNHNLTRGSMLICPCVRHYDSLSVYSPVDVCHVDGLSVHPLFSMSIHHSVCPTVFHSVQLSCRPVCPSAIQSAHPPFSLSTCRSVCLPAVQFVYPPFSLPIRRPVCLPAVQSVYPPFSLSIRCSICLPAV